MILLGIIGSILFILSPNGMAVVTALQVFSKEITLEFLQVMSVVFILGGIVLLIDGFKAP